MTLQIQYSNTSFYSKTPVFGRFLGVYQYIPIPPHKLDRVTTLTDPQYVNRPDLLALDIYGNDEYEWVIPRRSGFQDLIFDLVLGAVIIIPDPSYVKSLL